MALRIAICQMRSECDVKRSTDKALRWLRTAARSKADVVVFPEVAIGGYSPEGEYYGKLGPGPFRSAEQRVVRAAARLGVATVIGTVRWSHRGLQNSLLIVDRGGEVRGYYDKIHPAERWSVPGQRLPICTVAGVASCFLVCFDVRFPELVRLPAAAGARVCYNCSHHSDPSAEHKASAYAAMPIARAAENGIFFVSANAPGNPADLRAGSHGRSRIIDPDGNVLAEGSTFGEELVSAEIDPRRATRRIAKRALKDDTPLKPWLAEGMRMVARK